MSPFTVTLPQFEGPLELLLHLIERHELDITQLSLAAVTDEFLSAVETMPRADPDGIADFLVVAAKLLLLKSSLLLPAPPRVEADEEAGTDLATLLETYRQFRQVAQGLGEREAQGLRSFPRVAAPPALERRLDPAGLSLNDLLRALRTVLKEKAPEPEPVDSVVRPLRITVRQRIAELRAQLRRGQPVAFEALLSAEPTRQEVIATFLALLETLKLGWAEARQAGLWGRIELVPLLAALPDEEGDTGPDEVNEYV